MIQWLQNYSGIKSSGENIEQTELENLRREVKRYKKIMKAEEYLKQNVRGILQPMVSAVLLEKPKDPVINIFI